ncbi:MAG: nucleotidyltransferase [Ralstonia sp.]|uniref:nucleotidyltransferase domain-containing protein n=1 Tax=Ralstonia sp. TaxID=54061 RepID=UPI00258111A9|nr:nucleotidyltransferase [Ralstonia sp.]MBA4233831.1 nucleotidyltransferase [Ralstonia sp.]
MATKATSIAKSYLDSLAEELEISDTRYEQAQESYASLGRWFSRPASTLRDYDPAVYVQGSFGLGTVIKPLHAEEEYDVDAVCELKALNKSQLSQETLKNLVGIEMESYRRAQAMTKPLREGRRCWTLNYADGAQFHMDVVPALPNAHDVRILLDSKGLDASRAVTAIAITDNERLGYQNISNDWPRSNPKGYLEWFKSRMRAVLEKRRRAMADAVKASVEAIPDYKVRTPLQSSIMILKRHRDIMYVKDEVNCCPISIIITTLAAHAYRGEEEIADALLSILSGMEAYISRDAQGRAIIANPSDPLENFADKWAEFPERERAFYAWLRQAQRDFVHAASLADRHSIGDSLSPHVGQELAKRAADRSATKPSGLLRTASGAAASALSTPSFGNTARTPTKPQGFA